MTFYDFAKKEWTWKNKIRIPGINTARLVHMPDNWNGLIFSAAERCERRRCANRRADFRHILNTVHRLGVTDEAAELVGVKLTSLTSRLRRWIGTAQMTYARGGEQS